MSTRYVETNKDLDPKRQEYFASQEVEKCVSRVCEKIDEYFLEMNRTGRINIYRNAYFKYFQGFILKGAIFHSGQEGELSNTYINHYGNLITHNVNMVCQQKIAYEPQATVSDAQAQDQIKQAKGILAYHNPIELNGLDIRVTIGGARKVRSLFDFSVPGPSMARELIRYGNSARTLDVILLEQLEVLNERGAISEQWKALILSSFAQLLAEKGWQLPRYILNSTTVCKGLSWTEFNADTLRDNLDWRAIRRKEVRLDPNDKHLTQLALVRVVLQKIVDPNSSLFLEMIEPEETRNLRQKLKDSVTATATRIIPGVVLRRLQARAKPVPVHSILEAQPYVPPAQPVYESANEAAEPALLGETVASLIEAPAPVMLEAGHVNGSVPALLEAGSDGHQTIQ